METRYAPKDTVEEVDRRTAEAQLNTMRSVAREVHHDESVDLAKKITEEMRVHQIHHDNSVNIADEIKQEMGAESAREANDQLKRFASLNDSPTETLPN